jgi:hypothetical protein
MAAGLLKNWHRRVDQQNYLRRHIVISKELGHHKIYVFACVAAVFLLWIALSGRFDVNPIIGQLATAAVGLTAILAAAEFPRRADERARVANSIEIARRWDQEPFLSARSVVRDIPDEEITLRMTAKKPEDTASAKGVRDAMIHFANYYWEIAEAIESGWADEGYVRERFRETLTGFYPAFCELLYDPHGRDSSSFTALAAIAGLHLRWIKQTRETGEVQPIKERARLLMAEIRRLSDRKRQNGS